MRFNAKLRADLIFGMFLFLVLIGGALIKPRKPAAPQGFIDAPVNGSTIKASVPVLGWAIVDGGIASVGIYVDGRYLTDAKVRLPRPDVLKAFPRNTDGENSGWEADLNLEDLKPGSHVITAEFRANTGSRTKIRARVNLE